MPISKESKEQIYRDDLKYQEKDPDTIDLQFQETAPISKLLFTLRPEERAIIEKINYSLGAMDSSVNGYAHLVLTRITNPNPYAVLNGQNQVIWRKISGADYVEGSDRFADIPVYMHSNENIYLYLITNFPAPTKVFGCLTLYVLPTFR